MPGSIAARTMAWQRRMGGIAGPLSASGEASNGEPVQVELLISGVWTDITSYVMVRDNSGNIAITRGRRDEGSTSDYSTCQLTLNNRDGRFSPRNPTGTYYGLIGRNQPVRVSVPDGIGGKNYRFWGEISTWPQSWDTTGTDVWTEVEASGILRRLAQGPPPAHSVIYNVITDPQLGSLVAYWPCEDISTATSADSPLTGVRDMLTSGDVTFASASPFGGSDALPDFTSGSLTGALPLYDTTSVTSIQARFFVAVPEDGFANLDVLFRVEFTENPGTTQYLDVHYNDPPGGVGSFGGIGTLSVQPYDPDESPLAYSGTESVTMDTRGRLLRVSVEAWNSGSSLAARLNVLDVDSQVSDSATITTTGSVTQVQSIALAPSTLASSVGVGDMVAGHVTFQTTITPINDLGRAAQPDGETAGRRIQRRCGEDGTAFDAIGDLDSTVVMGDQERSNSLTVMQACEEADGGILYENMAVLGLGYRTRQNLYNQDAQLTLDYAAFQLSEIPTPVEDDRYIQNKVTVTVGDVSASYELSEGALSTQPPPSGVGVYGQDVALNLSDSSEAQAQAAWRVHLGTVDEPRYPQISINLAHSSFVNNPALKQAVLRLRQGDRVVIQNLPAWLPPGDADQLILGFEETITQFEHRVTLICAPASPYHVGTIDADTARIDTDGSELLFSVNSSATALDVTPSAGKYTLWTTDDDEFPFDVRLGGEVVRVTDITPYISDAFGRTESNGWGSADTGQSWTAEGGVASNFSVGSGVGSHTLTTVDVSRRTIIAVGFNDFDYSADITTSAIPTGDSLYGSLVGRYIDSSNFYTARLEFTTASTVLLSLRKRVANADTQLAAYTLNVTHVADTFYRVRFQVRGAALKAKAWKASDVLEPDWQVSATDTALNTSSYLGMRSIAGTSNTNVSPVVKYDNADVDSPQTFTVTRSINGVSKSQTAGEDIRLATPPIIAL